MVKGDRYKCQTCGTLYSRFEGHACKGHTVSILIDPIPILEPEVEPIKKKRGRPVGWRKEK